MTIVVAQNGLTTSYDELTRTFQNPEHKASMGENVAIIHSARFADIESQLVDGRVVVSDMGDVPPEMFIYRMSEL